MQNYNGLVRVPYSVTRTKLVMWEGGTMVLGDQFYDDLTDLVEKYSRMEMTNAEAVGYLMFKVNELMNQSGEQERGED